MRRALAASLGMLTFALLALVFVASGAQARPEATTITLSGWSAGKTEDDLLQSVVDDFNNTHPNIHVDYSVINGDYATAMTARFAARNAPDVFYVDSSIAPTWIKQGVVEPLNAYIKKSKYDTSKFYPGLLNAFKVGKNYYGFPKDWSPLAVEINKSMFAKAGIKKAPRTWGELLVDAQKLASSNAVPGGKPLCLPADWARMLAFVFQNKGSLANVQSPAVAAAVNYYVNFFKKGLAATPTQLGVGWPGEALGKEKAAVIFEGNWLLPYMQDTFPGVGYKTYILPKGKTRGNLGFTVSYSMSRFSTHKKAAWKLLSFLTGKTGMRIWTSKGLALPARNDVKPVAGRGQLLQAAGYSHPWQFAPGFADVMTIAGNELQAVINGSQSVSAMLQKIQSAAQQALSGG